MGDLSWLCFGLFDRVFKMDDPLISRSKSRRFQGNKIPKIGLRSFFTVNSLSPRCDVDGISPINIHQGTKPKFIPTQQNQVIFYKILI
jgi:hypothetical protein